ncbi:MAG TPA: hypothetical protein VN442_24135 [Bryobacteraceae bacterium]|nr:hypothetical protein [Bryobacteraceae bacterium]
MLAIVTLVAGMALGWTWMMPCFGIVVVLVMVNVTFAQEGRTGQIYHETQNGHRNSFAETDRRR